MRRDHITLFIFFIFFLLKYRVQAIDHTCFATEQQRQRTRRAEKYYIQVTYSQKTPSSIQLEQT